MYPAGELNRLELRKGLLLMRLEAHRRQCVEAGADLARPVEWIDRAWAKWRSIAPLAKVVGAPIAFMVARKIFGRLGKVASIARMAPLIFQTARMFAGRKE